MKITIRYMINDTVQTDTLQGTNISTQQFGESMCVRFPNGDGIFLYSDNSSLTGQKDLKRITYTKAMQTILI